MANRDFFYIDASALVALLTDEKAAGDIGRRMQDRKLLTNPLELAEASTQLSAEMGFSAAEANEILKKVVRELEILCTSIAPNVGYLAAQAYETYGSGNHNANLSLKDCMTYANAKHYRMSLLTVAPSFAATDLNLAP